MPKTHTVVQGEHISRIARKYGFVNFSTVWDFAQNGDLKRLRVNPNVLFPGDKVLVPDKEAKRETAATGRRHKYVLRDRGLKLRIAIKEFGWAPVGNTPCDLKVENDTKKLTTDGGGRIEQEIPVTAEIAKLTIRDVEYSVMIGHLDPVEEDSGLEARLNNLGYYVSPPGNRDEDELRSAIEEFQRDHDLVGAGGLPSGVSDAATQAKLKEVHGC